MIINSFKNYKYRIIIQGYRKSSVPLKKYMTNEFDPGLCSKPITSSPGSATLRVCSNFPLAILKQYKILLEPTAYAHVRLGDTQAK
jgi:hypothetical protein